MGETQGDPMKHRRIRRKWSALVPAAITAAALYWSIFGFAQTGPPALASLFPSGALLYLEAKDFGALLAQWDSADEKKTWLESPSYQVFQRSQLLLRLSSAQGEFAAAAGVPADYGLANSIAGGNSALAMFVPESASREASSGGVAVTSTKSFSQL